MKKIVNKIFLLFIFILIICSNNIFAIAPSRFYPRYQIDGDIQSNQIVMYFGWEGEDAYKITQDITIDTSKITILDVSANEEAPDFNIEYKEKNKSGNKVTYEFTATSNYVYNKTNYMTIVFDVNSGFKVKNKTEMDVSDIYAYNDTGNKYRYAGYYVTLSRESSNSILGIREDKTDSYMLKIKIYKALPFIIVGIVVIVGIIVIILVTPSRAHENRMSRIRYQLDPKNYPIPGVGPLPKPRKKTKNTIIEPEEPQIKPLSKYGSKANSIDEQKSRAIKKKPMEIDKNIFNDNPTKGNQESLTNINPMAFDDGEPVDRNPNDDNTDYL